MNNLEIYNKVREVPAEAKKPIKGGRLKGLTDINPMWRIKCLTEQFGVCGFGWYVEIIDKWLETSMASDEVSANVIINLYVKLGDEWSKPIQGIGGSMFVSKERTGMYTNDECYKMALTDAISVACKSLGMGADVYWNADNTKYNDNKRGNANVFDRGEKEFLTEKITSAQAKTVTSLIEEKGRDFDKMLAYYGIDDVADMTRAQYGDCLKLLTGDKQ